MYPTCVYNMLKGSRRFSLDLNKNIMFMFEIPRIKHVGRIAIHKVSLARFNGVGAENYLKACVNM